MEHGRLTAMVNAAVMANSSRGERFCQLLLHLALLLAYHIVRYITNASQGCRYPGAIQSAHSWLCVRHSLVRKDLWRTGPSSRRRKKTRRTKLTSAARGLFDGRRPTQAETYL